MWDMIVSVPDHCLSFYIELFVVLIFPLIALSQCNVALRVYERALTEKIEPPYIFQ